MKKSQHQLILEYVDRHGYIVPGRLTDEQRIVPGGFLGSSADARCRELANPKWGCKLARKDIWIKGKKYKKFMRPTDANCETLSETLHKWNDNDKHRHDITCDTPCSEPSEVPQPPTLFPTTP